jgi:hypothetical protein
MRFLKLVALSYLVKTILVGVAWLFIPDLPDRTVELLRRTWTRLQAPPAPAATAPPAPASASVASPR